MIDLIVDMINIFLVLFTLVYPTTEYAKYIDYVTMFLLVISYSFRAIKIIVEKNSIDTVDMAYDLWEKSV